MPRFPGCEKERDLSKKLRCSEQKMRDFIFEHVYYPDKAWEKEIEGTSVVSFVVETDGTLSNIKIVRSLEGGIDEEAMLVVELMNEKGIHWIPGKEKGVAVPVLFNLPIKFKMD